MSRVASIIGPQDHGRRMTLEEFDSADAAEGYRYELGQGVVIVVDVPNPRHLRQFAAIRRQFGKYEAEHPDRIYVVAGGGEAKILLAGAASERHPDLAIYSQPPPEGPDIWSTYIPDLVVEIVSPGSEQRDYVEKREEYFDFGVKEYWIVDEAKDQMLVLRRSRGQWVEKVVRPGEAYESPLYPGLKIDLDVIFRAARG